MEHNIIIDAELKLLVIIIVHFDDMYMKVCTLSEEVINILFDFFVATRLKNVQLNSEVINISYLYEKFSVVISVNVRNFI